MSQQDIHRPCWLARTWRDACLHDPSERRPFSCTASLPSPCEWCWCSRWHSMELPASAPQVMPSEPRCIACDSISNSWPPYVHVCFPVSADAAKPRLPNMTFCKVVESSNGDNAKSIPRSSSISVHHAARRPNRKQRPDIHVQNTSFNSTDLPLRECLSARPKSLDGPELVRMWSNRLIRSTPWGYSIISRACGGEN